MSSEDSEENLETLQEYIDWCFDVIVMKKKQNACSPAKSETPSSKRSRPADSLLAGEHAFWFFFMTITHVLQPKARRRLPKEVARQTRLKQHRRRVKALPTSWIQSTSGCPASTRGCPWSRSCTVNLNP